MYTKHLIIGGGLSGLYKALQLQREPFLWFEARLTPDEEVDTSNEVSDEIAKKLHLSTTNNLAKAGWDRFHHNLRLGYKVVSIEKTGGKCMYVTLKDGVKYMADHVHVCTSSISKLNA